MKKFILRFIACVPFITMAHGFFAQEFTVENRKFFELTRPALPPYTLENWFTTIYKFAGDTMIESKSYLKVLETTDSMESSWKLTGFVRETANKKVFFRNMNNEEGLLYDFSAEVGDTIYYNNYFLVYQDSLIVDSIKTVEICGKIRNMFYLHFISSESHPNDYGFGQETCMEGIGSAFGPFKLGIIYSGWAGSIFNLLCIYDGENMVYSHPDFESCFYDTRNTGGFHSERQGRILYIYPNPTTTNLTVEINNTVSLSGDIEMNIYNVFGNLVEIVTVDSYTMIIYKKHYSSGIYFIILKNSHTILAVSSFIIN